MMTSSLESAGPSIMAVPIFHSGREPSAACKQDRSLCRGVGSAADCCNYSFAIPVEMWRGCWEFSAGWLLRVKR